jgi:predicted DsbA family dithiol-disulfide isomerase
LIIVPNDQQAVAFLNSDELEAEVNQQYDKARTMGINGLPFVIIDGKWAIKGGHSSEVFVQVRYLCHRYAGYFRPSWPI